MPIVRRSPPSRPFSNTTSTRSPWPSAPAGREEKRSGSSARLPLKSSRLTSRPAQLPLPYPPETAEDLRKELRLLIDLQQQACDLGPRTRRKVCALVSAHKAELERILLHARRYPERRPHLKMAKAVNDHR